MKFFKTALIALLLLVNIFTTQPSWADMPDLTKGADYAEVVQSIDNLLKTKGTNQSKYSPEEIQRQIGELKLQKYILESARDWAQCRNETGKTLGVYARKPKNTVAGNTLFFLANGQVTDDDWNCDGVYLPSGTKVTSLTPASSQEQTLATPLAVKVLEGTQFVAKANPETGVVEFNVTPVKALKAGETDWTVPELSQTDIDAKIPDAPIEN